MVELLFKFFRQMALFKNIISIEKNLQVKDSNITNPQLDLACKSFLGIINIFISEFRYSFLRINLDLMYQKSIITLRILSSLKSKGNFTSIKNIFQYFPLKHILTPLQAYFLKKKRKIVPNETTNLLHIFYVGIAALQQKKYAKISFAICDDFIWQNLV